MFISKLSSFARSREARKISVFWRWWLLAVIIYLSISILIAWHYGFQFFISHQDDSATQVLMAKNLISYGTFSLDGDPSSIVKTPIPPLNPTNFLTPGYSFWLVFIYIIFKPLSIYHSGILQTEQLFVPIFLAGIYLFIRYLRANNKKFLYCSLFVFSASVLVRPIIFYFLPVLILIIAIHESGMSWKNSIICTLASLLLAYSVVGLWLVRNKIVLNTWQISSNQGAVLYAHHYVLLSRYLNIPEQGDVISLNPDPLSVEYNNALKKVAIGEISKYKSDYLKMYSAYLPLFFVSNGYNKLISRFVGIADFDTKFRNDLVINFLRGDVLGAFKLLLKTPTPVFGFLIGLAIWIIISLFALVGFWNLIFTSKGTRRLIIVILGFLLIYFAAVSTPFIVARYRLPINSFIFIFAMIGFYFLKDKLRQWI